MNAKAAMIYKNLSRVYLPVRIRIILEEGSGSVRLFVIQKSLEKYFGCRFRIGQCWNFIVVRL